MADEQTTPAPKFWAALGLLITLCLIFSISIIGLHLPAFVPLLLALAVTMIFAWWQGSDLDRIQGQLLKGLETGLAPLFLFLLIGMLIGLWMATGVIPSMLWAGFKLANPQWFVPTAFVVMAIVGTMIGSAFTTMATLGVALMGVGTAMGFSPALLAGAVISGAIFGDKSSPLSDSTNLSATLAEVDLFAHIKNLMWTTLPAFGVSLILFTLFGLQHGQSGDTSALNQLAQLIQPTWWALVPLGLLVGMAWLKLPAIITLMVNVLVSSAAFLWQGHDVTALSTTLMDGFKSGASDQTLQALFDRGGMMSMMPTVIIILFALGLGGLLTEQKILQTVMEPIVTRVNSQGGIITGTVATGILANFMIGEQYLATILPGQLWKEGFDRVGLSRLALSRALEDSGTVTNYLVPWGVAGAFAAQTVGVSVWTFAPFVFFAWLSPIFSLLSGWTGIGLKQAGK